MIAFVGSSMASNEVENKIINQKNSELLEEEGDCNQVYGAVLIYARQHGATPTQATAIAFAAKRGCFEAMGLPVPEKEDLGIKK